jgi:hypothetical protein
MTKQPEDWLDDVPVMTSKMKMMKSSGSVKVKLNVTPKN